MQYFFQGRKFNLLTADLEKALDTLTLREKKILKLRFFEGKTLGECGKKFGVTADRIRQIQQKALRKLHFGIQRGLVRTQKRKEGYDCD